MPLSSNNITTLYLLAQLDTLAAIVENLADLNPRTPYDIVAARAARAQRRAYDIVELKADLADFRRKLISRYGEGLKECDCSCHDLSVPAGCGNCDCKE